MNNQPTKEELQAQLDKTIEDLDKPETPEVEDTEEEIIETTPAVEEEIETTPAAEDTEEIEAADKEEPKETKPLPSTEDRYKESTKEAQRLYKNNVEMNKAISDANNQPEPTDEELLAEYSDWEDMSSTEKKMATEVLINKKFRQRINEASAQQRTVEEWNEKVDKYVDDPRSLIEHPELEGKVESFKQFAGVKEHQGTNFNILVSAFLHDLSTQTTHKKGKMLQTPTAGTNSVPKPKSDKIPLDQAAILMKTDYKLYKEKLLAGKIDTSL